MASYIYTASGSSSSSANIATNKIRIATTTSAIAYTYGANGSATANLTACPIIPANYVERDIYVGQGNVVAFINVAGTAGAFSITELGAPVPNTGLGN